MPPSNVLPHRPQPYHLQSRGNWQPFPLASCFPVLPSVSQVFNPPYGGNPPVPSSLCPSQPISRNHKATSSELTSYTAWPVISRAPQSVLEHLLTYPIIYVPSWVWRVMWFKLLFDSPSDRCRLGYHGVWIRFPPFLQRVKEPLLLYYVEMHRFSI